MLNMTNMQPITAQVSSLLFWSLSCRVISVWRGIGGDGGLPGWHSGKEATCKCKKCGFNPGSGRPTPAFLPGEAHGQRSLTGYNLIVHKGFLGGSVVHNLPATPGDTRDTSFIPGLGRSPGEINGNSLQYSWLENSMDRGAWQATVQTVERIGYDWMIELTYINSRSRGGYFILMLGWGLICSYTAWDSL